MNMLNMPDYSPQLIEQQRKTIAEKAKESVKLLNDEMMEEFNEQEADMYAYKEKEVCSC